MENSKLANTGKAIKKELNEIFPNCKWSVRTGMETASVKNNGIEIYLMESDVEIYKVNRKIQGRTEIHPNSLDNYDIYTPEAFTMFDYIFNFLNSINTYDVEVVKGQTYMKNSLFQPSVYLGKYNKPMKFI